MLMTTDHWARAWLVTLLDGAARAGLPALHQGEIHQLAFLANVLAPLYGLPVETGVITRWKRGPFTTDLQWDLDRLAILGLATLVSVKPVRDKAGAWFSARYRCGPGAAGFLKDATVVASLRNAHRFHCDLLAAYASLPSKGRDALAAGDATYANTVDGDLNASETVIDFAAWRERNYSRRAAQTLKDVLETCDPGARRELHIYLRYLASRASAAR